MYIDYFGLNELPFKLITGPKLFCHLPTQDIAFKSIVKCIQSEEPFITITGEVGLGKTMLYKRTRTILKPYCTLCSFEEPVRNPEECLVKLASSIKASRAVHEAKGVKDSFNSFLSEIKNKLIERSKQKRLTVLMIDDAHLLTNDMLECLRLLSNIEYRNKKLVQIILFAQPELISQLKTRELRAVRQRITFNIMLNNLTVKETKLYIKERLLKAGHVTGDLFNVRAMGAIHRVSNGVPRIINRLCHYALIAAMTEGQDKIGRKLIKQAVKEEALLIANSKQVFYPQRWKIYMFRTVLVMLGFLLLQRAGFF